MHKYGIFRARETESYNCSKNEFPHFGFILVTLKNTEREGIFLEKRNSKKNGLQKTVIHFVEDIGIEPTTFRLPV